MDLNRKDWGSPSSRKRLVGAAVVGLIAVGYVAGRGDRDGNASIATANASAPGSVLDGNGAAQPNARPGPLDANTGTGPVPLSELNSGPCRTLAPAGWSIIEKNNEGTIFSVQSADRSLTSAYAGFAVNGGMAQGFYGPQYQTAHGTALFLAGQVAGEEARDAGPEETVGPYRAAPFQTATHSGYVLYYRFPLPADPQGYGLITRIAIGKAGDRHSVGIAGAVMAATQCHSSLRPPPQGLYEYHARTESHGAAGSSDSDVTLAGTYNAQLNTGWAHDSLGRNFHVNVTEDWRNGPEGEGFYGPNGEKLVGGLQ